MYSLLSLSHFYAQTPRAQQKAKGPTVPSAVALCSLGGPFPCSGQPHGPTAPDPTAQLS